MLYAIAVILVILWAFGLVFRIGGSVIYVLLVLAVISILLRVIRGGK